MSKGKRYEEKPKLNMKKVFAVILAIIVIIMSIYIIGGILSKDETKNMISSKEYYVAFKSNKWGVIDSNGETIIEPSYEEMMVIPNNKKDVFLCVYDVNYETGEYKTKALNSKNQEILTGYEKIEAIQNMDENNNLWYEENVLKVQKDGKWGLINSQGKELLKAEYDEIVAMKGIKNAFLIKKENKVGVANSEGNIVLDANYLDVASLGKDNKSGFIVQAEDGKYGIIDYSKKQVLEPKYEGIKNIYGNDLYVVKEAGKEKIVNKQGEDINLERF